MNKLREEYGASSAEISQFVKLFYPFHYRVGFNIESALRGELLSQHQAVILWIVHSEGEGGLTMRRKDIEARIGTWFDITSSAISKALRSLARADMPFVTITEDPRSGREKRVTLTAGGQRQVRDMMARAEKATGAISAHLTAEEVESGLNFLSRVSEIVTNLNRE